MKTWRRITGKRTLAPKESTSSSVYACDDQEEEAHEEIDLIALKSTPDVFQNDACDVMAFELSNLSARYTSEEIREVKELRKRQLDVRPFPSARHCLSC
jgi:hypothetical protein